MTLHYFGTNLREAGHYLFTLEGDSFYPAFYRWVDLTFNPYDIPNQYDKRTIRKGDKDFYQKDGFSILVIEGSCYDQRWGTRTVFFVDGLIDEAKMRELINSVPIAVKILAALPFEVQW